MTKRHKVRVTWVMVSPIKSVAHLQQQVAWINADVMNVIVKYLEPDVLRLRNYNKCIYLICYIYIYKYIYIYIYIYMYIYIDIERERKREKKSETENAFYSGSCPVFFYRLVSSSCVSLSVYCIFKTRENRTAARSAAWRFHLLWVVWFPPRFLELILFVCTLGFGSCYLSCRTLSHCILCFRFRLTRGRMLRSPWTLNWNWSSMWHKIQPDSRPHGAQP